MQDIIQVWCTNAKKHTLFGTSYRLGQANNMLGRGGEGEVRWQAAIDKYANQVRKSSSTPRWSTALVVCSTFA